MPHIPRTLAPSGLNAAGLPRSPVRSTTDKPPTPYAGSGKSEANPVDRILSKKNRLIERLSMEKWDVDPVKVYKHLTGKELAIDEHSRLVSPAS